MSTNHKMVIVMNDESIIDYSALINESMYYIVKRVLRKVSEHGLCDNHHFYITYKTNFKGVVISEQLKRQYPEEITIVIQYSFKDLQVFDEYFEVSLSFGAKYTKLTIPFRAITSFADPSEMFELEFNEELNHDDFYFPSMQAGDPSILLKDSRESKGQEYSSNNVISLEKFRKSKADKI